MASHLSQFDHSIADSNPDPEPTAVAVSALKRLDRMFESRPVIGGLKLASTAPDCPHQCEQCFIPCATIPQRIAWWEGELARLGGVPMYARSQDGINSK